jgi:hypothetical protein
MGCTFHLFYMENKEGFVTFDTGLKFFYVEMKCKCVKAMEKGKENATRYSYEITFIFLFPLHRNTSRASFFAHFCFIYHLFIMFFFYVRI